jgi:hypothetical protein
LTRRRHREKDVSFVASAILAAVFAGGAADAQVRPRPTLSGPVETIASEDGLFRFHFTRSGVDAVEDRDLDPRNGVPDPVDDVALGVRLAHQAWVVEGGWPAPPGDQGVGGDDRIDFYVKQITCAEAQGISPCGPDGRLPSSLFGIARTETRVAPDRNAWTSYVIINRGNDVVLGRNFARSVAAHEYHHVIQFGMDAGEPDWVYEATAAYLQLVLFRILEETPFLVDALLTARLERPDLSLYTEEGRVEYSNALWLRYLVDRFGDEDIVRKIWARAAATTEVALYDAFDEVLGTRGSSFLQAFVEWGEWNYFLCGRDDGQHYAHGGTCTSPYGSVRLAASHRTYPVIDAALDPAPQPLGFAYVELRPDGQGKDLLLEAWAGTAFAARLLRVGTSCATEAADLPVGADGRAQVRVEDVHRYHRLILVFANLARSGSTPLPARYSVRTEGTYAGPPPLASASQRSLDVSPRALDLAGPGETARLLSFARFDDCTSANVTLSRDILWRSQDPAIADVDATGLVTARAAGRTQVFAVYGGHTSNPVPVQVGRPPAQPPRGGGGCFFADPRPGAPWMVALAVWLIVSRLRARRQVCREK